MFHHLAYKVTAGINDVNVDMVGVTDNVFTLRSTNHFIFSEKYNLLAWAHMGTSVLRARLNVPSLNPYGRHNCWPVNRSATPPSYPRLADYRDRPIAMTVNEEWAIEESGNLGAATEPETSHLLLGTPDWTRRWPSNIQAVQMVRATATVSTVAGAWGGLTPLVFADPLFPGWYVVLGAYCFEANTRGFRFVFPRFDTSRPPYSRQYRPGWLCTNATGNLETPGSGTINERMGVWGAFFTTDLPQVELFDDGAAARTAEFRILTGYLGQGDPSAFPNLAA